MKKFVVIILALLAVVASCPALAAGDKKAVAQVPGDDIFGFTSPSDVGQPGDTIFANENDGRFGKRQGVYRALNAKYELSRTVAENWWLAGSFFGAYNHARGVSGLDDVNHLDFDGLAFEIVHRIVARSAGNPFAVSLSLEPRWGRVDGTAGMRSDSYSAALKLFVDAAILPDRLFWAGNLVWAPQRAQDPGNRAQWLESSATQLSTALTYQLSAQLFLGGELRYLSAFDTAWPDRNIGNALYAGPTMLWKINEKVALSATYQQQIAGRSAANPGLNLDLDNFERAQFRLKLAVGF